MGGGGRSVCCLAWSMSGGEASGSWPPRGINRLSSRAHLSQRVEAGQRQVTGDRLSTLMSCICLADPGRGPVRKQKETGKAGSVREDDAQGWPGAWTRGPATRALPWSASASSNGTSKKKPFWFSFTLPSRFSQHTHNISSSSTHLCSFSSSSSSSVSPAINFYIADAYATGS